MNITIDRAALAALRPVLADGRMGGASSSPKMRSNFAVRVVSGVIMAAFSVYVIWLGGLTYGLFIVVLSLFIFLEYSQITAAATSKPITMVAWGFWLLVVVASFATSLRDTLILLSIGFFALLAWEIVSGRKPWISFGFCYALLPFISLVGLRGGSEQGFQIIMVLFLVVWATDSFGYLVGKPVGGPKLAPTLSPNKTWSGFIGGAIGGPILAYGLVLAFGYEPAVTFLIFPFVLSVISQIGDLVESGIKRKFDIKDSGTILPGHGGVLDRVDGLIFASVAAALLCGILFEIQYFERLPDQNVAIALHNTILPSK